MQLLNKKGEAPLFFEDSVEPFSEVIRGYDLEYRGRRTAVSGW